MQIVLILAALCLGSGVRPIDFGVLWDVSREVLKLLATGGLPFVVGSILLMGGRGRPQQLEFYHWTPALMGLSLLVWSATGGGWPTQWLNLLVGIGTSAVVLLRERGRRTFFAGFLSLQLAFLVASAEASRSYEVFL